MPVHPVLHALLPEAGPQGGNVGAQEAAVFSPGGVGVPAEDPLFPAVHPGHDLGRVFRSPLGEQMGRLKVFHAAAAAHPDPPPQPIHAESIFPVLHRDLHQLHGQPFASGPGVQGRGVYGGQDHVDAARHGAADEALHHGPVGFAENGRMVILGQAVAVEPFGVDQLLLWQQPRQHPQRHRPGGIPVARAVHKRDFHGIIPGPGVLPRAQPQPQAGPAGAGVERVGEKGRKQVGVQAGGRAQAALLVLRRNGILQRHLPHHADGKAVPQGRSDFQPHFLPARVEGAEGQLKINALVLEPFKDALGFLRRLIQKHLVKTGQYPRFQPHAFILRSKKYCRRVKRFAFRPLCDPSVIMIPLADFLSTGKWKNAQVLEQMNEGANC